MWCVVKLWVSGISDWCSILTTGMSSRCPNLRKIRCMLRSEFLAFTGLGRPWDVLIEASALRAVASARGTGRENKHPPTNNYLFESRWGQHSISHCLRKVFQQGIWSTMCTPMTWHDQANDTVIMNKKPEIFQNPPGYFKTNHPWFFSLATPIVQWNQIAPSSKDHEARAGW